MSPRSVPDAPVAAAPSPTVPAAPRAVVDEALAALRDLREATERALAALERDDPEAANLAIAEGAAASARLTAARIEFEVTPPDVVEQVQAVKALQGLCVERAVQGRERTGAELERASQRDRGLRGYRPAGSAMQPGTVDRES